MAFRFIHTADLHLDSPLKSLALRNPDLGTFVGMASRQVLSAIVDLSLQERVDALLIAGDLYDSEQTSLKTTRFFLSEMARLKEANILVYMIRGNHDALLEETKALEPPENLHLFGTKATKQNFTPSSGKPVFIHGLSFSQKTAVKSFLPQFEAPESEAINIGLMHTSLDGAEGHDDYAPCKIRDLQNSGFSYWALGHIHRRSQYSGSTTIVMPGMPQGRDINESGVKSVTLGCFSDDGILKLEERPVALAQFERFDVDVDAFADLGDFHAVELQLQEFLHSKLDQLRAPHLIARLTITGSAKNLWEIRRDQDLLIANLAEFGQTHGQTHGRIWLEHLALVNKTEVTRADSSDPLQQLRSLIADEVQGRAEFMVKVHEIAEQISKLLPDKKLRGHILGQNEEARQALINSSITSGLNEVLARLHFPQD